MEKQDVVVVEKKNNFWTAVKIILIVAGIIFIAAKIYQKISQKRKAAELEAEEDEYLDFDEADFAQDELEAEPEAVVLTAEDAQ
ncbi:MAG: hypothetical protein E7637_05645 [Ruminococcaceae bacterium]|nr:hypothetical protein [Oscillospiraceae bacterium]